MKINILLPLTDDPKGGGNQFLKTLKKEMIRRELYSELDDADVILFNSYQNVAPVVRAKRKFPHKIFVHRIDGPIRLYNNMDDKRDDIVYYLNEEIADATVYQSQYSKKSNMDLGCPEQHYETVISNSSDPSIFFPSCKSRRSNDHIRIIATSFSDNWKKGFSTYQWMDENIDINRYEMVFVGRSPCEFKNIKMLGVMNSSELAKQLRLSDIFITASQNECCTNSLIEAISCGIPSLAINSGGNAEIIQSRNGGVLFEKKEEIPSKLEHLVENYEMIKQSIYPIGIDIIAQEYVDFFEYLMRERENGNLITKKLSLRDVLYIRCINRWK